MSATPLPVEVIVRGVMTGSTSTSIWKQYEQGKREIYGYSFADGIAKNTLLPEAIITPTTKGDAGAHDEPLTNAEVVDRGFVDAATWATVQRAALALFARGQEIAKRGRRVKSRDLESDTSRGRPSLQLVSVLQAFQQISR
jgi:phosphoribosylaminoimidazole-succinocarboxamide synthase